MLLRDIKNIFHTELNSLYPKAEVASFFYMLIENYLDLERFILALQPDLVISKEEETTLFEALSQLKLNIPIQHIFGKTDFMDMDFVVTKDVLIPRPETEELVRWILDEIRSTKYEIRSRKREIELRILDIGTGSGCIAISLAKKLPNAKVYALDISEKALEIANQNAVNNEVAIEFIKGDILDLNLPIRQAGLNFDVIVSNPPYVRESERSEMHQNVLDHEPELALFVSDENPLVFYENIIEFASANFKKGGVLFFEINQYLGKETEQLLKTHNFSEIEVRKDMFGKDRMLMATQR